VRERSESQSDDKLVANASFCVLFLLPSTSQPANQTTNASYVLLIIQLHLCECSRREIRHNWVDFISFCGAFFLAIVSTDFCMNVKSKPKSISYLSSTTITTRADAIDDSWPHSNWENSLTA